MALKAANQSQIGRVTLLAILISLDVMRQIQDLNFSNHPTVANELVKFLAVNQEFQSVKDLQVLSTKIKDNVSTMRRKVTEFLKSQQTSNNKIDQLQKELAFLTKRFKALE